MKFTDDGLQELERLIERRGMAPTMAEFAPSLAHLGLSRRELVRLIDQAMEAGAADPDQPAGALREFWIRAADYSRGTCRALGLLGLDQDEVVAAVLAGGDPARRALGDVLGALRSLDDRFEQHAAAVDLFGVAAEDLGDALLAMEVDG